MLRRHAAPFVLGYLFALPITLIMFREDGRLTARSWALAPIFAVSMAMIVAIAFGRKRPEDGG
ncbi:hypothetical protein ABZX85_25135 [Streptomyces sp. NPDC004539]|uniref:hypothetical protein n=1 Tax=Streptomyces sp. NPDC004539 TaxID=3154280 RepID=UPI0033A2F23C